MSRPIPSRPGLGRPPAGPLPVVPPNRPTSNYEQSSPKPSPPNPRPVTSHGLTPQSNTPPSKPPPTPPGRGGSTSTGGFNGTATAPSSFSRGPPSKPPPTTPPTKPPPTPPSRNNSVSVHTDRQNVAAVVDLPINDELVQKREITPPPRPAGRTLPTNTPPATSGRPTVSFNGSATHSPGSLRKDSPPVASSPPERPPPSRPPRPGSLRVEQQPTTTEQTPTQDTTPSPAPTTAGTSNDVDREKQERLRQEALKEIVNTERDYVQHLELVSEIFLHPLKEQQKILSQQELGSLFSNWELLVGVNQEILNNFDKDPNNIMVGQTFLGVMQYLKMYKIYCANQPTALKVLETQQAENSAFAEFLQECYAKPKWEQGQNLFSYLIKPIQRLCKYPLLIKVLLQHTDPSHPDYQNLTKALGEVEDIVNYVNEGKRQAEKSQKVLEIALATEGGETLGLVTPTRNLEMEQALHVIIKKGKPQTRKCLLFNDALLLVKESKKGAKTYTNPKLMGLDEIKVVNVSDCDEFKHGIELQYSEAKEKYVLIFETEEVKQRWLREIKRIVKLYQQKKFEEMKKEEEEKEALAKLQATPPPVNTARKPSLEALNGSFSQSSPSITTRRPSPTVTLPGPPTAPLPTAPTNNKKLNLMRRSSFNNKTQQISVIKPAPLGAMSPKPVKGGK